MSVHIYQAARSHMPECRNLHCIISLRNSFLEDFNYTANTASSEGNIRYKALRTNWKENVVAHFNVGSK